MKRITLYLNDKAFDLSSRGDLVMPLMPMCMPMPELG